MKREEVLKRRMEVAELYLKGWFQSQIAEKYGVGRTTITQDLKVIYRMWRQSAIRDFNELKERELIKIDNLERTYWAAWEESVKTYEKEKKKYLNAKLAELNKETIYQFGDKKYLDGVQWCIDRRCKLLGLDAPVKTDHISSDGSMASVNNETIIYVSDNDDN